MTERQSTALVRPTTESPEDQELKEKHRLIEELESEYAGLQLDYSTLAGELGAFRSRYYLRVGGLYARLDILRAEIRAIEARQSPEDDAVQKAANEAREQAEASCNEVNDVTEDDFVSFEPTPELKQLYRRAAKLIHPDRARDEEDRQMRERMMSEINVAYSEGDADQIAELINLYHERLADIDTDDIGAQLVRAIRTIARIRDRIAGLVSAIEDLKTSEWAKLKVEVEEGEARGKDPLGELAEKIHGDILETQEQLNALLAASAKETLEIQAESVESSCAAYKAATSSEPTQTAKTPSAQDSKSTGSFRSEGLIHRTERGEKVRSKSEAIIANILYGLGLDYRYEFPIEGHKQAGIRRPDFVVFDVEHRPILWEHLGMLDKEDYRQRWNAKLAWYEANGFTQGIDLFITRDDPDGGLDSQRLRKTADYIHSLVLQ